ncbi:MAG: amidohydrolase family protein [Gammaproteobacteria bacterium]|nr:amidohydrolase family protein [Gammaproteobacteria bacterium]
MSHREPIDLLLEARWLLPMTAGAPVLAQHAVAIRDGRIVALGPAAALAERFAPREHLCRGQHVLLPGLINAHTYSARVLRRTGVRAAQPLHADPAGQPSDHVRDGVRLAMAEMLCAGITCFADLSLQPEEVARAVAAGPMRACVALPVAETPTAWAENLTGHLARAERLWDAYRSDARIGLFFLPLGPAALSEATLTRLRRVTDELDARIALALYPAAEDLVRDSPRVRGTLLAHLAELGLLRPGVAVCGSEALGPGDPERIERAGAALVLSPRAALALGHPRLPAPLPACTGLGCEDPARTGALDVLEEARTAAHLGLSASEALRLATLGGATALGLQAQLGSLEPGKLADLVCIGVSSLPARSYAQVPEALLFGATRADVSDVWCTGRAAVSEGRLLAFDTEELTQLRARWAGRLTLGAAA